MMLECDWRKRKTELMLLFFDSFFQALSMRFVSDGIVNRDSQRFIFGKIKDIAPSPSPSKQSPPIQVSNPLGHLSL